VIAGTGVLQPGQPAGSSLVGPLLVTQNIGNRADYQAQLLGVVIDDRDGDRFYDIGEGLGGITITATGTGGTFTTQSWSSGGYQMVLPNGSYTVSFSGGGLTGAASYTTSIGTTNVKLDAFAADFRTVPTEAPQDLTGTDMAEVLEGRSANDILRGMGGNDTLWGLDGSDTLIGGEGDDFLYGGSTEADLRDVMFGGAGNDTLDAGWGNDELNGGAGDDWLEGGFGSDTMIGNEDNDMLIGGAGSDLMFGGPGNDTLNGGWGFDRMNGGAGADRFFHVGVADHGSDWVQDYSAADGDVLVFGLAGAIRAQFQINRANTPSAGSADVDEAFVIYRPTGQIMWALVDGMGQDSINVQIGGQIYDLLA
jgi:Ca2+-binding RTX toxin-like protein